MYDSHIAVLVLLTAHCLNEISVHEPDFIARIQSLVLRDRRLHKVIPLNIQLTAERDETLACLRVLEIIICLEHLCHIFRIIVDHELNRVQDCHHARDLHLEILADAVLQHSVVH